MQLRSEDASEGVIEGACRYASFISCFRIEIRVGWR